MPAQNQCPKCGWENEIGSKNCGGCKSSFLAKPKISSNIVIYSLLGLAVCVCLYILISSIPKVEIKVARKPRTSAIVFDVKNISDKSYDVYRIYYDGYNIDGSHIYHGDLGCAGKLDSGESGEWTDVFWIHDVPDTVKIIKVKARILGNVDESEIPFKQIN